MLSIQPRGGGLGIGTGWNGAQGGGGEAEKGVDHPAWIRGTWSDEEG